MKTNLAVKLNHDWIMEHARFYPNKWIALHAGVLILAADTYREAVTALEAQGSPVMETCVFQVGPDITHYSNWSSQPDVQIFCTKEWGIPAYSPPPLPPKVYQLELMKGLKVFYTFEKDLVTCPECRSS